MCRTKRPQTVASRYRHTQKWHILHRPVRSYFMSVIKLLQTLPEADMVYVALNESAKMVPYLHQD